MLATHERLATMKLLDSISDLVNASELRQKILFFVIVVSKVKINLCNFLAQPTSLNANNKAASHFTLVLDDRLIYKQHVISMQFYGFIKMTYLEI